MHREPLLELLASYRPRYEAETETVERLIRFVSTHEDCFERSLLIGHVTASAWVLDPGGTKVLLTHHAKLDRWLQLGGHVDGENDVAAAALREAREESGIDDITLLGPNVFDIDIHAIPARGETPEHLHHDVRFLMQTAREDFIVSSESHDLAWVPMVELEGYTSETSMLRMRDKAVQAAGN